MSKVLMFPGQGAQFVGMAKDLYEEESYQAQLNNLQSQLNQELLSLMFEGPLETLSETKNTQPAIVMHACSILENHSIDADFVLGHSLGEYIALVASGVISSEDAVKITRRRGELMQNAYPVGIGAMAAIMGTSRETIEKALKQVSNDQIQLEIANINAPGQIVVSGHKAALDQLIEQKSALNIKKIIPLNVSGPFHSSLMKIIADDFRTFLDQFSFNEPNMPVIQNVSALPSNSVEKIKDLLVKQLYGTVEFEASIEYLLNQGATTFIEIGPGKVLNGLVKKIAKENGKSVEIQSVSSLEEIRSVLND
ncbi:ACP S-malonyltransferase [Macrococcus sp. DPC7161]|uniref:ACP S-malonyltransferase n=1 Tax=Macrococcus sp. DPC7161 TaxID=2507060 RepID=UPI00100BEB7B|nr:ACP S-malonyltransferase [Macrococcus sp. DPC7161]RXK18957.1 [acyl-carrier-protein] S-malonyltransferase [Macrococcus sp. DPC7161]